MTQRFLSVCLVMTALVSSTNAFASRARQIVMGTADPLNAISGGSHGSFYYDDNYNMFYNPSYANDFKNWVAIEKTNGAGSGAEGGFVANFMNINVGWFGNRADSVSRFVPTGATTQVNALNMRPWDLIIAGDTGLKWGLGLTYGNHKGADTVAATRTVNEAKMMVVKAGIQIADIEPFVDVTVQGSDKNADRENKTSGFGAGVRYHFGEWVPFAAYRTNKNQIDVANNTALNLGSERKTQTYGVGLGRNTKLAEGTNLNYAVSYWRETKQVVAVVPVDISIEHDMASWLVMRGGFKYNVFNRTKNVSSAATSDSTGRIGATVKAGKANFDFAVGHVTNTETVDGQGFDFANGLFSAASLTYAW